MPKPPMLDIRGKPDEELFKLYKQVDELYHQGKTIKTREHKSGWPAIIIECDKLRLLTDTLSAEKWWAMHQKADHPGESSQSRLSDHA